MPVNIGWKGKTIPLRQVLLTLSGDKKKLHKFLSLPKILIAETISFCIKPFTFEKESPIMAIFELKNISYRPLFT